ncbi:uncharacterized protein G2W53_010845 [Senna tora]|uniref:Uncharacterized protein n=1 Tax=Senna tora TaxID=362788 RepID=A0A834X0N4_9FABA|nr:uncharacterized protein G2W53_010845 [Senna tora]
MFGGSARLPVAGLGGRLGRECSRWRTKSLDGSSGYVRGRDNVVVEHLLVERECGRNDVDS